MDIPKYSQTAIELLRRIRSGIYTGKLPPMRELAAEFDIAIQTMFNAVQLWDCSPQPRCLLPSRFILKPTPLNGVGLCVHGRRKTISFSRWKLPKLVPVPKPKPTMEMLPPGDTLCPKNIGFTTTGKISCLL